MRNRALAARSRIEGLALNGMPWQSCELSRGTIGRRLDHHQFPLGILGGEQGRGSIPVVSSCRVDVSGRVDRNGRVRASGEAINAPVRPAVSPAIVVES